MSTPKRKRTITALTERQEEELWENSLIVWDTSALCRLYNLTPAARDEMLAILYILKDNIWLSDRVLVEFLRHNEEELRKPLSKYGQPKFLGGSHISKEFGDFVSDLKTDTFHHPNIAQDTIKELETLSTNLNDLLEKIRVTISNALKIGKEAYTEEIKQDPIYDLVCELPKGEGLTYAELKALISEGHIRYKHKIPPGYEDEATKDSIDIFGDLIIWKETIKEAQITHRSIIFVTQDLKEDWNSADDSDRIIPREELLYEFHEETGQHIWMYTISSFLQKLCKYKAEIGPLENPLASIDKIKIELGLAALPENYIKVECPNCKRIIGFCKDDFDWDWHWSGQDDRDMGVEISYGYEANMECPYCDECIALNFEAYMYPIGVINYVDCESYDCEILHKPKEMTAFIEFPECELETCCQCGSLSEGLDENGFCPSCRQELDDRFNED